MRDRLQRLIDEANADCEAPWSKVTTIEEAVIHWREACHVLRGEVRAQHAELERLRAVVERLPKTADGVPVVPGDFVFCPWPNRLVIKSFVKHECHGPDMVCFAEGSTTIDGFHLGIRVLVKDTYSTREAAEAAMKGATDAK